MTAAAHKVQLVQVSTVGDMPYIRTLHEVAWRYGGTPRRCPDCTGRSFTVPPPEGITAAVLLVHDAICPAFGGALQRRRTA
jgi:hypothetical protein